MKIRDLHCHLSGVPADPPEARMGQILQQLSAITTESASALLRPEK
jgi:hypothetical protein